MFWVVGHAQFVKAVGLGKVGHHADLFARGVARNARFLGPIGQHLDRLEADAMMA
jgi:hypothetical protein